jgi:FxsC-like protein
MYVVWKVKCNMADAVQPSARSPFRFFLSYSWKNGGRPLKRFFEDLAEAVRKLVGGPVEDIAFRDRVTMIAGTEWPAGLLEALTTSQVMVYLLSADYIQSDFCGKELQVFLERAETFRKANPGVARIFVQPVIWVPIMASTLPSRLGIVQPADDAFPDDYASKGLESLAKRRDKTAYQAFIDTLAQRIVEAGQGSPLAPLTRYKSLDEIPNAFLAEEPVGRRPEPESAAGEAETGVRCIYVAPKQSEAAELMTLRVISNGKERPLRTKAHCYSPVGGWHWQPYNPPASVKIGSLVQQLITELPYREIVLEDEDQPEGTIERALELLGAAAKRGQIILLIVDAWAVYLTKYKELMLRLDEVAPINHTAILVPWNETDVDSEELRPELELQLRVLFKGKYLGAQPSPFFKSRVTSIDDFRAFVPAVVEAIRIDIETLRAAQKKVESTRSTPQVRSSRGNLE